MTAAEGPVAGPAAHRSSRGRRRTEPSARANLVAAPEGSAGDARTPASAAVARRFLGFGPSAPRPPLGMTAAEGPVPGPAHTGHPEGAAALNPAQEPTLLRRPKDLREMPA